MYDVRSCRGGTGLEESLGGSPGLLSGVIAVELVAGRDRGDGVP